LAHFTFDLKNERELMVKVGISYVSIEQARNNLDTEITEFQFDKIKLEAEAEWQEQLGKIEVKGGQMKKKPCFIRPCTIRCFCLSQAAMLTGNTAHL
jgi:putative alpha-1,2-mannosidase